MKRSSFDIDDFKSLVQLKEKLDRFGKQHGDISEQIILQSRSQMTNKAIKLNSEIALNTLKQSKGIYIYENQPWERAFINAWKKYNHGELYGFVTASIHYWLLSYLDNTAVNNTDLEKVFNRYLELSPDDYIDSQAVYLLILMFLLSLLLLPHILH